MRRNIQIVILYNEEDQPTRGEARDQIALQDTIATARAVYRALQELGYPVIPLAARGSLAELETALRRFPPDQTFILNNCDGFNGNNLAAVEVLRLIESLGFPHSGADARTVAMCIDKARSKERLSRAGLHTPAFQVFTRVGGKVNLRFPLIVKPVTEDGSLGIDLDSVVTNCEDLFERVRYVLCAYQQPALVEEFIPGREFAVSVWGNGKLEVLPIYEEDYSRIENPLERLLTYEAKWVADSYHYNNVFTRCPADLEAKEERLIRLAAARAFQALGLRDFARLDMRYQDGKAHIIEVNELPDLAPESGFARTARTAGYSYAQTIERILRLGLERARWR